MNPYTALEQALEPVTKSLIKALPPSMSVGINVKQQIIDNLYNQPPDLKKLIKYAEQNKVCMDMKDELARQSKSYREYCSGENKDPYADGAKVHKKYRKLLAEYILNHGIKFLPPLILEDPIFKSMKDNILSISNEMTY